MSGPSVHSDPSNQEQQLPFLSTWQQVERALEAHENGQAPIVFQMLDLHSGLGEASNEIDQDFVYQVRREEDGTVNLLGVLAVDGFAYDTDGDIFDPFFSREIRQWMGDGIQILDLYDDPENEDISYSGHIISSDSNDEPDNFDVVIMIGPVANHGEDEEKENETNRLKMYSELF